MLEFRSISTTSYLRFLVTALLILLALEINLESTPALWWDEGWTLSVARNWVGARTLRAITGWAFSAAGFGSGISCYSERCTFLPSFRGGSESGAIRRGSLYAGGSGFYMSWHAPSIIVR